MSRNTVKNIREECAKLLEDANKYDERIDLFYATKALNDVLNKLNEAFTDNNYNEAVVTDLKEQCNREAITLERILSRVEPSYKVRYTQRKCLQEVYTGITNVINLVKMKIKNIDSVNAGLLERYRKELGNLLVDRHDIQNIYISSKYIDFEYSCEEDALVQCIKTHFEKVRSELRSESNGEQNN